jgi:hypothetical protein
MLVKSSLNKTYKQQNNADMQTQNIFIAHPTNTEQVNALKAFVKALKIKFEITTAETPYNQEFVDKILQGDEDFKAGKGKKMTMDELNGLWK